MSFVRYLRLIMITTSRLTLSISLSVFFHHMIIQTFLSLGLCVHLPIDKEEPTKSLQKVFYTVNSTKNLYSSSKWFSSPSSGKVLHSSLSYAFHISQVSLISRDSLLFQPRWLSLARTSPPHLSLQSLHLTTIL